MAKRILLLVGLLVGVLTFVVFAPTLQYPFVNWDDNIYVYQNPHFKPVTLQGILHFFTNPYFRSWTPVTFVSHAIDVVLWDFNPTGHHLTNVLLHSVNAALVFWLALHLIDAFKRKRSETGKLIVTMTSSVISGSVIAALVFALHPLRAESVAWISDRKDLLCTFFMLLTTIVYFTRRENLSRLLGKYPLLLVFYALALGSKSTAMVLPAVFILFDITLFRPGLSRSLKEISPMVLLAVGAGIMAKLAAPDLETDFFVGETTPLQLLSFPFTATLFYLKKLIYPQELSPVYHTNAFLPAGESPMLFIAPLVILAVTVFCLYEWWRGRSYWIAAWGVFLLFLTPTFLGLLSGIQPVADRYTYAASIGLCVLAGGGVERIFRTINRSILDAKGKMILAVCVVSLSLLSYKSMQQIKVWSDPMKLWTYVIPRAPFPLAYNNMGMIQLEREMYDEAIASFEKAVQLRPAYGEAWCNMGIALNKMGEYEMAMQTYRKAIEVEPDHLDSYINLGTEYLNKNMPDSAIAIYQRAITIDPTFAAAYYNIGLVRMQQGRYSDAVSYHQRALAFAPASADGWYNIGVAYEHLSQSGPAIESYTKAIEFRKDYLDAYINLGKLYAETGNAEQSLQVFGKALSVNSESADVYYNLGYVLYGVGEVDRACTSFETAIRYDSTYATAYHNLGVIYGQRGDQERSVSFLKGAAKLGYEESQQLLREKGMSW